MSCFPMFRAKGPKKERGLMFGWGSGEMERTLESHGELCSSYIHPGHANLPIQTSEILIGRQN